MDDTEVKYFIEAALLAAGRPMSIEQLHGLFDGRTAPEKSPGHRSARQDPRAPRREAGLPTR